MAVDHDVDVVADGFAHRGHTRLGVFDGPQTLERRRLGNGHGFESGKSLLHSRLREFGKARSIAGRGFVKVFHPAAAQMTIQPDEVAHRTAPQLMHRHAVYFAEDVPQRDVDP